MPPADAKNPAVQASLSAAERNSEVIEKLRARADTTAKAFGTLATTAVTAVGIAKIGDVFPYQSGLEEWLVVGGAGFLMMLAAIAVLTARLWGVSQPIPTRTDPELMKSYLRGDEEKTLVREVYDESAALNGVRSLRAYEARAHRFERIADQLDDASAAKLRKRAEAIRADVRAVTSRAAALLVRKRAERVIVSGWTILALGSFAAGVVMFAVAADRLDSARDGEIKVAKACAEARAANASETELPAICGKPELSRSARIALNTSRVTLASNRVSLAKACAEARDANAVENGLLEACGDAPEAPGVVNTPSAEDEEDAAFVALAQGWLKCRAALRKSGGQGTDGCARLRRAMIASLEP